MQRAAGDYHDNPRAKAFHEEVTALSNRHGPCLVFAVTLGGPEGEEIPVGVGHINTPLDSAAVAMLACVQAQLNDIVPVLAKHADCSPARFLEAYRRLVTEMASQIASSNGEGWGEDRREESPLDPNAN